MIPALCAALRDAPGQLGEWGEKLVEWNRQRVDLRAATAQHAAMRLVPHNWRQIPIWNLNIALWCLFAVLFFIRVRLHLEFFPALGLSLFNLTFCLVLSGALVVIYRRLEQRLHFDLETASWIIALSLAATIIQSVAAHQFLVITGWQNPSWSLMELWLMRLMFFRLLYLVWSLLYFWLRAEQTARVESQSALQARADAQRMELLMLRSQLDPHFLFNALNGIAAVVHGDSPPAAAMVRELADYLRYSLDHRYDTMVPLAMEIDAMMAYLRIEQARFSEELHVEITTDEEARRREVPCFLLLPLVENAVKHSFREAEPPWNVSLNAETRDGTLIIEVCNTGTLSESSAEGTGVGLDVLRRRLELHYPGRHELSLSSGNGTVVASLRLEGDPCSA
ncbi:MAG TPA: histidine kinase [Terrimicrobiaceae bacterium]|nr:histidine kinase [Terrimicrobiaceae bacterium]